MPWACRRVDKDRAPSGGVEHHVQEVGRSLSEQQETSEPELQAPRGQMEEVGEMKDVVEVSASGDQECYLGG